MLWACRHTPSQSIHTPSLGFFILLQLVICTAHLALHIGPYVLSGLRGGVTSITLKGDMDSGLPSSAACSLPVQDMQLCHFHLRVDCCWDPLTLCLGGSNRAQLMRGISWHVVTCILVKCSIIGYILMPGADFQEVCYFLLWMSRLWSRTPGT